jgi:hypothetical protein
MVETEVHHFCEVCADEFFKKSDLNSTRKLIQFSPEYRAKLFDRLEAAHPEIFEASDAEMGRAVNTVYEFLREQLKSEGVELNDDGLGMLAVGFWGADEWHQRRARHRGKEKK